MILMVIAAAYLWANPRWSVLVFLLFVLAIIQTGTLLWAAHAGQPGNAFEYDWMIRLAPRVALALGQNALIFAAFGAAIVEIRRRMREDDREHADLLKDIAKMTGPPKDPT